jgi:hypothetical protein
LLLYNAVGAPLIFRKRLAEDEKKILACWHMLVGILLSIKFFLAEVTILYT